MKKEIVIQQDDFRLIIAKIITVHYPDEQVTFEISGNDWVQKLYTTDGFDNQDNKGLFNFLEEAKTLLECVTLIIGTFKTVKALKKKDKNEEEKNKTILLWTQNLIEAGVEPEKAMEIASKFYKDINNSMADEA